MSDAHEKNTAEIVDDIKSLHRFIVCDACGENNPPLRCSRCKLTYYCSSVCQRMHWKEHKPDCRSVASMRNLCEGIGATVPPSDDDDVVSGGAVNSECGICLEEEITDPVVLEHCKHAFCFLCLKEWQNYSNKIPVLQQNDGFLLSSSSAAVSSSCPLCRQQISVNLVEKCTEKAQLYASRGSKESLPQEERRKCYELALQQVDIILTDNEEESDLTTMALKASILTHTNPVEAVQLFKKILTLDEKGSSNAAKITALLDQTQNATDTGNDELAARLMNEAEAFYQHNHYFYRNGHVGDPRARLFDIKIMLAEAHEAAGQWKDAADVYLEVLRQIESPEIATPRQSRCCFSGISRCFYELKLYEKAVNAGEGALAMNRHYPGVHKLLACPQRAMGKIQVAVATMSRSVLYEAPWDDLNRQENIEFLQVLHQEQLHLAEECC